MILPLALALFALLNETSAFRFVCYYGSWSVYRQGPGKFRVEDIDPNVCTHIIYTFGGIDYDGKVKVLDAWNDIGDEWHEGAFTKLQKLKLINPKVKLMFAVGGWNEGSEKYSKVMGNPLLRRNFVQSALNFTRTYKFDGFDLDWEYPAFRGGKPSDKESFSLVVKELAEAFRPYGLILSAAVSANALNIAPSYDCPTISKYLTMINVMTYDLHGAWDKVTGHHTALFPHPSDKPGEQHLNVNSAIRAWIKCGAIPSKMNIGVASYGRTFTLANANNRGIGAPATGPGPAGKFVPEAGFLAYNEICFEMKQNLWTKFFDNTQQVPYAVKGNVWVGYDDPSSIVKKVQLAKELRLGGAMIWSIETDDFRGDCGLGKNPLLNAVKNALLTNGELPQIPEYEDVNDIIPSILPSVVPDYPPFVPEYPPVVPDFPPFVPDVRPTVPQVIPSRFPPVIEGNFDYKCRSIGQLFRDPLDCSTFYMCTYKGVGGELRAVPMKCGNGLVFDESIQACNFQSPDCPLI